MRQHVKPVGCDSRHMPDSVQITSSLVGAPPRPFRHSAGPPLCPDEAFQRAAAVGRRGASSLCLKPRETRHLVRLRKTVQHESGTSALASTERPTKEDADFIARWREPSPHRLGARRSASSQRCPSSWSAALLHIQTFRGGAPTRRGLSTPTKSSSKLLETQRDNLAGSSSGRAGGARAGAGEPVQIRFPRRHKPRAADAAQLAGDPVQVAR
jgi:hypothetical protein